MVILCVLVGVPLIMAASVRFASSHISLFELERRSKQGDTAATKVLRRERLLADVVSLRRALVGLLLVVFATLAIAALGWGMGIVVSLVVALELGKISQVSLWQSLTQKLYQQYEDPLLMFVEKYSALFRFIRSAQPTWHVNQLSSREELEHLIAQSGHLLSSDEKKHMQRSLTFATQKVNTIMTPRGDIASIDKKELLGPLVLDDLHKTGHSRFPVTDGTIDQIVGMLYVHNLLTLDTKRSPTVEKAMEPRVFYIRDDQTLSHALAAFLRTHHHLFIVINQQRETVGLLSLEDVVEALLGRKIIDEFDTHEDLARVAART